MRYVLAICFFIISYGCQAKDLIVNNELNRANGLKSRKSFTQRLRAKNEPLFHDSTPHFPNIIFERREAVTAAPGTKSVLFNASGTKLYAMNLEGMSIYEFDQPSRKILREFKFRPTKGPGWDYEGDTAISSYEEKPVEACFTHHDKILWVSLHNAGGIVPIMIDSFQDYPAGGDAAVTKHITVIYPGTEKKDSFDVPLIKTGKTPKVISKTSNDEHLLVSNWHSNTITVLELNPGQYPYARSITTIPVSAIPRGIAVDDKNHKSYIGIMGGSSILVLNNSNWRAERELKVAHNPRHILADTNGRLFISYNKLSQIACINTRTGKTQFTAATHARPRTIALSKSQQFIFVTCYNDDMVDVFKITKRGFKKLYSIRCKGKPVGVDIFEDDKKLEAWVCTYTNGTIHVLSFRKSY